MLQGNRLRCLGRDDRLLSVVNQGCGLGSRLIAQTEIRLLRRNRNSVEKGKRKIYKFL